jgi:hypothetical protein
MDPRRKPPAAGPVAPARQLRDAAGVAGPVLVHASEADRGWAQCLAMDLTARRAPVLDQAVVGRLGEFLDADPGGAQHFHRGERAERVLSSRPRSRRVRFPGRRPDLGGAERDGARRTSPTGSLQITQEPRGRLHHERPTGRPFVG